MLSCIFGKCSSETYVVNKVSSNQRPSIVGTRIASSKETEYPVLETRSSSENQQTTVKEQVTHFPAKQNGQIIATTEESSRSQVSQNEDKNHKRVSPTIQTAQSSTTAEKPNRTHTSTKNEQNSTAATKTTNTQISQRTGNTQSSRTLEEETISAQVSETAQIIPIIEDKNRKQVSPTVQTAQSVAVDIEKSNRTHRPTNNEQNSTAATKTTNTQISQRTENAQSSRTSEEETKSAQVSETAQIIPIAEDKNRKQVSPTIQTAQSVAVDIEKSNRHIYTPTNNEQNLTAATTKTTDTQVSQETAQIIHIVEASEERNNEQISTLEQETKSVRVSETAQSIHIVEASEERNNEQTSQITHNIETSNTQTLDRGQTTQNDHSSTVSEQRNSTHVSEVSKSEDEKKSKETQSKKTQAPRPPPQKVKEDKTSKSNIENGISSAEDVISEDIETEGIKPSTKSGKRKSGKGEDIDEVASPTKRRSGLVPIPVNYDEDTESKLPVHPKSQDDETLIRKAIERNDFLNKIISGKRLEDVVNAMYNKEISARETVIKQGEKGSHMYISAKGTYQIQVKNKVVNEFNDVRVFGELALLYNAKRLATIKALTPGRVWVLDRNVYQQITVGKDIKKQDETMQFLMNSEKLKVVGKEALQEVSGLLKSEFFKAGTQIVRQGDKGNKFYIISAGTVTITKDGQGIVGLYKKGDCFGELALLKEDCRQATVTADAPGVECLTLTRKQFVDHFGDIKEWEYINVRPQDSIKDGVTEHEDIDLRDLKIIKTLGVGGFGRVELVQHKKKNDLVFALKYLKKIDIVVQHQQEHVYNEKNIQMACKSPFIVRLYRTYKDNKYIYLLMESCLGGDLWSLLQKQKLRRFDEKEARFIAACVLESFEYLHTRGIIYRDLKPENLLIAANGYIKLTDFGFAKKISSRGKTFTFAGTPEYVAPEIVLNRGHDRSVDYWAFGAFIFELLTGRTPFRTDDSSHMKTYNKILSGIDNVQFPSYVNLKARHIVEKLCRPVPSERLGMQKSGIKAIKDHKWFLGFDWQKFAKCEVSSPFRPKLRNQVDTQYFDQFKKDTDIPPDELSGWDNQF